MDEEIYLWFCVPETDVNCVLWANHVDFFFIVTAVESRNNWSSEGGQDSRPVKVGSR